MAYWFSFYDSVYEHYERPSSKIINNDDLLDKWVESMSKEVENRAKKNSKGVNNVHKGALEHEEVIFFDDTDEEYYEDAIGEDGTENNYEFNGVDYD